MTKKTDCKQFYDVLDLPSAVPVGRSDISRQGGDQEDVAYGKRGVAEVSENWMEDIVRPAELAWNLANDLKNRHEGNQEYRDLERALRNTCRSVRRVWNLRRAAMNAASDTDA